MDLELYEAAERGDIEAFRNCQIPLDQVLTICNNTILHVFLSAQGDSECTEVEDFVNTECTEVEDFVNNILHLCPKILMLKNDREEIPLHLAARYGNSRAVNVLILHMKKLGRSGSDDVESGIGSKSDDVESVIVSADDQEFQMMMRTPNKEKDTPLHEAAKNGFVSIVKILKQEDRSSLPYPANAMGHTPFYIAARLGRSKVVAELLEGSQIAGGDSRAGPNGRTTLHAAVDVNDLGHTPLYIAARLGYLDVVAELLERSQIVGGDSRAGPNGRTALHAAVNSENDDTVKVLLKHDRGAAYIGDKDSKTALHLAAASGYWEIMETIISHCPDCCEQVDNKGWNALHYAAANRKKIIICSSIKNKRLRMLLNGKDYIHGNTPAHLLAALTSAIVPGTKLAINKQEHDCYDILWGNQLAKKQILESLEASGISTSLETTKETEVTKKLEKARELHLIVATLIATVTFAAAFTMPGGLKSDDDGCGELGTPILIRNTAFKTFVVADALAVFFSLYAVFLHFLLALPRFKPFFSSLFYWSILSIHSAIVAMAAAFITGTLAVLSPSTALAMTTYIIGLAFLLLICVPLLRKILEDKKIKKFN